MGAVPTVMITGASRGIGLEFARQYAADGWRVLATCRDPGRAEGLARLAAEAGGEIEVRALDVTRGEAVARLAAGWAGRAIDLLVNNAGIYGPRERADLGRVDYSAWAEVLDVNVMGALRVAEAFADHVAASDRRLIAVISSRMGSIAENETGGNYIYRSSKAALNAVVKSLALDLEPRGVVAVAFHPGWVRTDMGGPGAAIDAETSVAGMRRVIAGLGAADSGRFLDYEGAVVAW